MCTTMPSTGLYWICDEVLRKKLGLWPWPWLWPWRWLWLWLSRKSARLEYTGPWIPSPAPHKPGVAVHVRDPSTLQVEAGRIQSHLGSIVSLRPAWPT